MSRYRASGEWLQKVVLGYYQYHAVPGNLDHLRVFMHRAYEGCGGLSSSRSQQGPGALGLGFNPDPDRWIPVPRVLHPYPTQRFDATHPRWEPYA